MRETLMLLHKSRTWVLLAIACSVSALAVWTLAAWRAEQNNAHDAAICERVDALDSALLSILNRSLKGLPANRYYRRHPDELATALRNTRYAIRQLELARC